MLALQPLWLSLRLSLVTTGILLLIALPLAYWLAYSRYRGKVVVEAIVSLPMVLPPSVLGFYLLLAFSPSHGFGKFLDRTLHIRLVFTFPGLVIASLFYSLPFMVNPILSEFKSPSPSLNQAPHTSPNSSFPTLL